jgi:hypothetical protein
MPDSPNAAHDLEEAIVAGTTPFDYDADDLEGATDCPQGCKIEADGTCPHGYRSAGLTLGVS